MTPVASENLRIFVTSPEIGRGRERSGEVGLGYAKNRVRIDCNSVTLWHWKTRVSHQLPVDEVKSVIPFVIVVPVIVVQFVVVVDLFPFIIFKVVQVIVV